MVSEYMGLIKLRAVIMAAFLGLSIYTEAQRGQDTIPYFTIDQCVDYAVHHQPLVQIAVLNQAITRATNFINISGWLPQVGVSASATHYFTLPTTYIPDVANPAQPPILVQTGVRNSIIPSLTASQAIFSANLLYYATSAHLFDKQARQSVDSSKIDLIAGVTKSFYNLLLTLEQITVYKEDTARLAKNLSDTYHQYIGGIVDKTDYKEAAISLNNSIGQLKQAQENMRPLYAGLKQLMGYPPEKQFNVSFDTLAMMRDIAFDTTQQLQFEKRIEYQQLQTAQALQHKATNYYRLAFLPTLSAQYDYSYEFENNTFSDVFNHAYPYSYVGLSLNFPIFTGFSRVENIRRSKLMEQQLNWGETALESEIYTEYTTALASYKGNLYNLGLQQENVAMAKDVYMVVELQYKQGIVAYLNVITAEDNLITSEIGYINSLFTVLSNKIDLEKAMGNISSNQLTH
jgi:outer membrane protein TolC